MDHLNNSNENNFNSYPNTANSNGVNTGFNNANINNNYINNGYLNTNFNPNFNTNINQKINPNYNQVPNNYGLYNQNQGFKNNYQNTNVNNQYASFSNYQGIAKPNPNLYQNLGYMNGFSSNGITSYVTSNKKREDFYSINKKLNSKQYKFVQSLNNSKKAILVLSLASVIILIASYYVISYATSSQTSNQVLHNEPISFEENSKVFNMNQIIANNMNINTFKETVNEQREIEYPIRYLTYDKLPAGEEQLKSEGKVGTSKIISVRTYEDNEIVEENIIEQVVIQEPVAQEIYIGTSTFLKSLNVHLNDLLYTSVETPIYSLPDISSPVLGTVPFAYDVTLLDITDNFCKVKFEETQGYILNSSLTSASVAPELVEKARLRRIIDDVNIKMAINKKSGLCLSDFKKLCENNPSDTYKIFEQNYEAFYNVEQKYNVNGVFLIALAIHESGWGTSQIAQDKKNLFGYGSYDRDPYNMSYTFDTYEEGIELVAKVLQKSYLNPKDTKIYNNEVATGQYYNGNDVAGINVRYSTDSSWHLKVYNYIKMLYNKLDSTKQIQVKEQTTATTTTNTNTNSNTTNTTTSSNTTTNTTTNSTNTNTNAN